MLTNPDRARAGAAGRRNRVPRRLDASSRRRAARIGSVRAAPSRSPACIRTSGDRRHRSACSCARHRDVTVMAAGAVVDAAAHRRDDRDARAARPASAASGRHDRQAEAPAVPGGAQRTQPRRRASCTTRFEQGLAGIALQLEAVAGSLQASPERGAPVARRRAADAAVQPGRGAALGDGSPLAGAGAAATSPGPDSLAQPDDRRHSPSRDVQRRGTDVRRLDAAQEHHLLRIGLEALTNALKHHADATRIDDRAAIRPERRRSSSVHDDGCGLGQTPRSCSGRAFRPAGHSRTRRQAWRRVDDRQRGRSRHAADRDDSWRRAALGPRRRHLEESWRTS